MVKYKNSCFEHVCMSSYFNFCRPCTFLVHISCADIFQNSLVFVMLQECVYGIRSGWNCHVVYQYLSEFWMLVCFACQNKWNCLKVTVSISSDLLTCYWGMGEVHVTFFTTIVRCCDKRQTNQYKLLSATLSQQEKKEMSALPDGQ